MINVLVTGADGQVGNEFKSLKDRFLESGYRLFFTNKNELNVVDFPKLEDFCKSNNIKIIINTAAYTAVDRAENDEIESDKINHIAVKNLATIAKEYAIKLIHISTDYVFDGENFKPYTEEDITNPKSIYGRTKLDGEKAMMDINPVNSAIIRTSWVYGSIGNNFVKTMLRLGKERDVLGVVFDQIGTPTYARDLAKAIFEVIEKLQNSEVEVYHYSNEGVLSWYDFAKEIMKMAKISCVINPIETSEYPTPAKRPYFSVLNKSKIKKDFNLTIPYWKDSLSECLKIIGEKR